MYVADFVVRFKDKFVSVIGKIECGIQLIGNFQVAFNGNV